jgi:protein-disulfide isomerase
MKRKFLTVCAVSLALSSFSTGSYAQYKDILTKREAGDFIRQYLKDNPEVVVEALENYQLKQQELKAGQAKKAVSENQERIFNDEDTPTAGPDNATAEIAYFFDYNCGFCKRALPTVSKLLEDDKKLKIAFKELPILGESSMLASKYALAVHRIDSDKYQKYHNELMKFTGSKTDAELTRIAKEVGIDTTILAKEISSKEISEYLGKIKELAQTIGINGTPAFIVGDQLIPGAVDVDTLKAAVAEARKKKD